MQENSDIIPEDSKETSPQVVRSKIQPSKIPEIQVDASTLMLIAVLVLLVPLIITGFFR